jgi:hypothetical protein
VVLYLHTVRKNGKRLDAQIYSNCFVFANWLRRSINLVYLNKYGNIVFTSGCPCDNGCLDKTLKLSMEASLNSLSELGNIDPAFIEFHPRVLRYGKTLLACLFGFEIREAFLLTEELDESGIQISECGLCPLLPCLRSPVGLPSWQAVAIHPVSLSPRGVSLTMGILRRF